MSFETVRPKQRTPRNIARARYNQSLENGPLAKPDVKRRIRALLRIR